MNVTHDHIFFLLKTYSFQPHDLLTLLNNEIIILFMHKRVFLLGILFSAHKITWILMVMTVIEYHYFCMKFPLCRVVAQS